MPSIQILPIEVVQQIAAGEVIDSVAAVVRELAENAIDAQADRISIALSTIGDIFSIQMSDNGKGISPSDLSAAALPHSTNKISTYTDLECIQSLGFRGEALHSIAQFAQLEICSRQPEDLGYQIKYDRQGYPLSSPLIRGMSPGTIVTATSIFKDLPRSAALPDRSQQLRHIQKQIYHLALPHPTITWQVTLESRPWFTLWGGSAIINLLPQMLSPLQEVDLRDDCTAQGSLTLGLPDRVSRRRTDWLKVALNGRVVHFPEMEQTILQVCQRLLPKHRYPIVILHLQVPPSAIDWNRHPAKSEIYLHQLEKWQTAVDRWLKDLLHLPATALTSRAQKLLRMAEPESTYTTQPVIPTKVVGQLQNTYIVIEQESGIWLVEQHVAHERILFEQIEKEWQIIPLSQPLLIANLSLTAIEQLQLSGIDIDSFGDRVWAVRSLPRLLLNHPEPLAAIGELSREESPAALRARVACLSAIRNGTPLETAQMEDIIRLWQSTQNPHTCPHGRPIYLHLGTKQLAHFFRRP